MNIELSIIVPVYNVEQYLGECLDSIYAVENIKKEIILVNDGSTDGSLEILKRYKEKYPDITILIDKKNGGVSSARNAGIKVAKGDYISFIDSDDWIDSKKYEEFFKEGQKDDLDIMISGPIFYKNGIATERDWFSKLKKEKVYKGKEFLKECCKNGIHRVEVWDDIYKKSLLLENNILFEEGVIYEDGLFTPLILNVSKKVKVIDINYYYYRQREGSIMSLYNKNAMISGLKISIILLLNKEFQERVFQKDNFYRYQANFARANILYLKEHFKLLFLSNLTFQDRLWLLKVLKYVKEIKWSINKEI